jgi:tripartite-type tricarboxylate transporter receptor subunit TctC
MKLPRRNFLHLAACAAALPAVSRFAFAQTYPSRPVRIIVGFPPGPYAIDYACESVNSFTPLRIIIFKGPA